MSPDTTLPTSTEDVAIIGMACRVAGATSTSELWENLQKSADVRREIDRFSTKGYYHQHGGKRKGLTDVKHAYLMNQDIQCFDHEFFAISPQEARSMDPQHRFLLEVTYEAMENAGLKLEGIRGTEAAVYAGLFVNDYQATLCRDPDEIPSYQATGTGNAMAANRISYFFDLHGPSVSIDTACSSTMVALNQACKTLQAGESPVAIVCGANLILNPEMFISMSESGFLSPDGMCQSFDESANGYARGEGCIALILKPLSKALADSDPIRAVVKGTRINQDGRTLRGITHPSSEAQRRNMNALYEAMKLDTRDVQYIEAHGTGTKAGDPIEIQAIRDVYLPSKRSRPLVIGSVKSNIGHLEACAALAGIVKTVEALERGMIPPQMNFKKPNLALNLENMIIPTESMSWPKTKRNQVRCAAVNSFGFGGTNGHCVLSSGEEYSRMNRTVPAYPRPFIFKISANTDKAAIELASRYATYIDKEGPSLQDLAHTLFARRTTLKKYTFWTSDSHDALLNKLRSLTEGSFSVRSVTDQPGKVCFIMTGQGAQWAGMGAHLLQFSPIFRASIAECERALGSLTDGPAWSLAEELCRTHGLKCDEPALSQPLCTALQIGLIRLWKYWGVSPVAAVGHSSGEIAAAFASGLISLQDAMIVAYYRGKILGDNIRQGAMCAIAADEATARQFVRARPGKLSLAAINSPTSCTLSGDLDAVESVELECSKKGIFCRRLRVNSAYHSHHMLPRAPEYEYAMKKLKIRGQDSTGACTMYSSVTSRPVKSDELGPSYWTSNMVSTVNFLGALNRLKEDMPELEVSTFIEVGPHPALRNPVTDSLTEQAITYCSSVERNKLPYITMLESAARLEASGFNIGVASVNSFEPLDTTMKHGQELSVGRVLSNLPAYAWDHSKRLWAESRASKALRTREHPRQEVLGSRVTTEGPHPTWKNSLSVKAVSWLHNLKDAGVKELPNILFLSMITVAAKQLSESYGKESGIRFSNISFEPSVSFPALNEDSPIETHVSLRPFDGISQFEFDIFVTVSPSYIWKRQCSGVLKFVDSLGSIPLTPIVYPPRSDVLDRITTFHGRKTNSLSLSRLEDLHISSRGVSALFKEPDKNQDDYYAIDPLILSSVFGLNGFALAENGEIPYEYDLRFIKTMELGGTLDSANSGRFSSTLKPTSDTSSTCDLVIKGEASQISFEGMRFEALQRLLTKPKRTSPFYKPLVAPDIAFFKPSDQTSFPTVLKLFTHKYPDCDVGMLNRSSKNMVTLLDAVGLASVEQRPRLRSLQVVGGGQRPSDNAHVSYTEEFSPKIKLHLLVIEAVEDETVQKALSQLAPGGFICAPQENQHLPENVDFLFTFENGATAWYFGRCQIPFTEKSENLPTAIFYPDDQKTIERANVLCERLEVKDEDVELIKFDSISTYLQEQNRGTKYNAIFLDSSESPFLTSRDGEKVLALVQGFMQSAKRVLWISDRMCPGPSMFATSSLLRTCLSEQPNFKATSLAFEGTYEVDKVCTLAIEVFEQLELNNPEPEYVVRNGQLHVTRFYPDDGLSASVGLIPPLSATFDSDEGLMHGTMCGKIGVGAISEVTTQVKDQYTSLAAVENEATMLDLQYFLGGNFGVPSPLLGQFFCGKLVEEFDTHTAGTQVIGWSSKSNRSHFQVSGGRFHVVDTKTPERTVANFARFAIAFLVLEDHIRARPGDTFYISAPLMLKEAFECLIRDVGARLEADEELADFSVEAEAGLVKVNRQPINLAKLIEVRGGARFFPKVLQFLDSSCPVDINHYSFTDDLTAVCRSVDDIYSTVITYQHNKSPFRSLVIHNRNKSIFSNNGAYIVVGGLGGLGKLIVEWMAKNGAETIVVISRTKDPSSLEARQLSELVGPGCKVNCIQSDACNHEMLEKTLSSIREVQPIRGIINLAMTLSDAPLISMKPEQWNTVLRTKIDSSINLHELSEEDNLDFFIMFSSVSSIIGNRAQGNYSTANGFLNGLAEYRRALKLPGVAIALGMMVDAGMLQDKDSIVATLRRSGLRGLNKDDLLKTMEVAVTRLCPPILVTGLESFEIVDGVVQAQESQPELFWVSRPEFGSANEHTVSLSLGETSAEEKKNLPLGQRLRASPENAYDLLQGHFVRYFSSLMGYKGDSGLDVKGTPIVAFGLDSLGAMACRYWIQKEVEIDIPVFEILGSKSLQHLINAMLAKVDTGVSGAVTINPVHHKAPKTRPLSHSQRRLWFLQKFLTDKTAYNLLLVCKMNGKPDIPLFQKAWTLLVQRHDVLHSKIVSSSQGPQQIPFPYNEFPLEIIDSKMIPTDCSTQEYAKRMARQHHFDVEAGEVVRGWLVLEPPALYLASHHLAWDRLSSTTVFQEVSQIYKALLAGAIATDKILPPVKMQFVDYALWQEEILSKDPTIGGHEHYWTTQLAGIPSCISPPSFASSSKRPAIKSSNTSVFTADADVAFSKRITSFCKKFAITPFMLFTATLASVLHKYTGDTDLVIGVADGDRGHADFDHMIGFTVNMLPIRFHFSQEESFNQILENTKGSCLEAYQHRVIPFDSLLSKLQLPRDPSHSPIFQISVNYILEGGFPQVDFGGFKMIDYEHYNARTQCDINLEIEETMNETLTFNFEYDHEIYDEGGIGKLFGAFMRFTEQILANSEAKVREIDVEEKQEVYHLASESSQLSIFQQQEMKFFPEILERRVTEMPDETAFVVKNHEAISYRRLGSCTAKIANILLEKNVEISDKIGIYANQTPEMILAVVGAVRAGAAYVPLDSEFPEDRISSILEDTEMTIVLADFSIPHAKQKLVTAGFKLANVLDIRGIIEDPGLDTGPPVLARPLTARDPIYCLFTSGSTGRPKGVSVLHGNLMIQLPEYFGCQGIGEAAKFLLGSHITFDMSVPAIFGTLLYGGICYVASRELMLSPQKMIDFAVDNQVTYCAMTPTQLGALLAAQNAAKLRKWNCLHSLVLGGEAVPPRLVKVFFDLGLTANLWNGYGPTETTICVCLHRCSSQDVTAQRIPVGPPLPSAKFYILDEQLRLVSPGIAGQLFVSGKTVSGGYVNRPNETANAFLPDISASEGEGRGLMYATGDSFRMLPNGEVEILGRIGGDRQVKIRGMRTELGEIEAAIWDFIEDIYLDASDEDDKLIDLAVVQKETDDPMYSSLTAYLVRRDRSTLVDGDVLTELRHGLLERLPEYMVPNAYEFLPLIPQLPSGKTDYKKLAAREPKQSTGLKYSYADNLKRTNVQNKLGAIWRETLKLQIEPNPNQSFFELGGHSMLLVHIQDGIKAAFGVEVPLGDMFATPSLEGMEKLILSHPQYNRLDNEPGKKVSVNDEGAIEAKTTSASTEIDWAKECCLPPSFGPVSYIPIGDKVSTVAITGATSMVGAHFLHYLLTTTKLRVYCIATGATGHDQDAAARNDVISTLVSWKLLEDVQTLLDRMIVWSGNLADPTLGMSLSQIGLFQATVEVIYHLDSDVSLLKNYDDIKAGNVGAVLSLLELAKPSGHMRNPKPIVYISTWGVPHLQAWNTSTLSKPGLWTKSESVINMTPGSDQNLGYLKCRFTCESLLVQAATLGFPVGIYRCSMCSGSSVKRVPMDRSDINRRILAASLNVGAVPDFSSREGGGMSWITADFAAQAVFHLSRDLLETSSSGHADIRHVVSRKHTLYRDIATILEGAYNKAEETPIKTVEPASWFRMLKSKGVPEMTMFAEVLEKMRHHGWIPFELEAEETLARLERAEIVSRAFDAEMVRELIVGMPGF